MSLFHKGLFAVMLVFASPAAMSMQTFLEPKATPESLQTQKKVDSSVLALDKACAGSDPAWLRRALKDAQDVGLPQKFLPFLDVARARLHALEAAAEEETDPKTIPSRRTTNLKEEVGLEGNRLLADERQLEANRFSSAEKVKAAKFDAALKLKREKATAEEKKFVASYKRADAKQGDEYQAGGHRDYQEKPPEGFSQREWAEWKKNLYTGDMPEHIQQLYPKPYTAPLLPEGVTGDESIDFIPATEGWSEQPRVLPWKGHAHFQEDDVSANRFKPEADVDIRR